MRRRSLAGAAALALVLAACGSEDINQGGGSGERDDEWAVEPLLDRVPSEATQIVAMDMRAARRELGVAPDLDPKRYRSRSGSATPEAKFDNGALKIVGYVSGVGRTPVADAIDHGAITAAVHAYLGGAGGELKIYKTSQSRGSIARGLQEAGLRAVGRDVYVLERPKARTTLKAVALDGGGLVVVGETADVVSGVLGRSEPDPRVAPLRRMIEASRGALRAAYSHVELPREEAPCVRRVAGGELFTPGNEDEDLVLELHGEPRASGVVLGTSASRKDFRHRDYRVSDVSRQGQFLTLKVRTPASALASVNAATIAENSTSLDLLYRCPGAAAARARAAAQARRAKLPDR